MVMVALMRWRGASESNLSRFRHVFSSLNNASTSAGDFFNCTCNFFLSQRTTLIAQRGGGWGTGMYLFKGRLHDLGGEFSSKTRLFGSVVGFLGGV